MKIFLTIIYFIIIGQGCFFFGLLLPRERFDEDIFPYKSFGWERKGKVYNALRIKKWKCKVPDMSMITDKIFPKRISLGMTSKELDRLIKESCVAEFIHYVLSVLALGFYYIWKGKTGTILTILYIFGNLPYVIIQRYNRPKFVTLREKLKLREERTLNANV